MHGNPYSGRIAALRAAFGLVLGRPLSFLFVAGVGALALAAAALTVVAAWRALPLTPPPWMQAEALVVVAGGEGEVDLAALRSALRASVQPPEIVASVDFLGRDAALRELAQRKDLAGTDLAGLRPNPLPDSFQLRFAPAATPDQVEAAAASLRRVKNVDTVLYQPEPLRRAALLSRAGGVLALVWVCALAAAILAAGALAIASWSWLDPQELRVLHLLGAERGVGVRPAAYAAALSVLVSAFLAWWLSAVAGTWLEPSIADLAQRYSIAWKKEALPPWLPGLACAGAALLGGSAAALALRLAARRRLDHAV